jgi:hypothetical protein
VVEVARVLLPHELVVYIVTAISLVEPERIARRWTLLAL